MNYKMFLRHVMCLLYTANMIYANSDERENLSVDFLETLDMTCVSLRIAAPDINNGYVVKYDRQNIKGKTVVVALYSCDENYDFEENSKNTVYCSKGNWVGILPECIGHDTNYDDYEESDNIPDGNNDSEENKLSNEDELISSNENIQTNVFTKSETEKLSENILSNHIDEDLNRQCPVDHNCDHICNIVIYPEENTPTYVCDCNPGYSLGYDKTTCIDIDECNEIAVSKKCLKCENTPGSYTCIENIDHIEDSCGNNTCENASCNPISSEDYACVCFDGFIALSNRICRSRDCRDDPCHKDQFCKNTDDSFRCAFFDPCEINNGGCSHTCTVHPSNSSHPICECPENQIILEDNKSCGCPINTILNENQYCENTSDCSINNGNCEQNCENSQKGIICSCFEGYRPYNMRHCEDIDECLETNLCQQDCTNSVGSFECKCSKGYFMDDKKQCSDINECDISSPCQYNCTNLIGGFKCHCPDGFEINEDNSTCKRVYKPCDNPISIEHGVLRCNKNKEPLQCEVFCDDGYVLRGSGFNVCINGKWKDDFAQCVPISCAPLRKPHFGNIFPTKCMSGINFIGEICSLHCYPGYVPVNKKVSVCHSNQTWSAIQDMDCIKIKKSEIFIRCPQNTTIMVRPNQKNVFVRLERPKSNVNPTQIKSLPSWAQNLDVQLELGVHKVTFRAFTEDFTRSVSCNTVITVLPLQPPKIVFCPRNFEITLGTNEIGKSVVWKEPIFEDSTVIEKIHKSKASGDFFIPGVHSVIYEATNNGGLTSRCEFNINIKSSKGFQQLIKMPSLLMDNHESFLICEGKSPIKISPITINNIPANCLVKNVKVNPLRFFLTKRRLLRNRL